MKALTFCVLIVGLSGCATAGTDILPRIVAGVQAAKDVYAAVCNPIPKGAEDLCADLKVAIDRYDEVGSDVIKVAAEVTKPVDAAK